MDYKKLYEEAIAELAKYKGLSIYDRDFFDIEKNQHLRRTTYQHISVLKDGKLVKGKIETYHNYPRYWTRKDEDNNDNMLFQDLPRLDDGTVSYTWMVVKLYMLSGYKIPEEVLYDFIGSDKRPLPEIGWDKVKKLPSFLGMSNRHFLELIAGSHYVTAGMNRQRRFSGVSPVWMQDLSATLDEPYITVKEREELSKTNKNGSSKEDGMDVANKLEKDWLLYIEGLTDPAVKPYFCWETKLEKACWEVFQWQKQVLAKHGIHAKESICTSFFDYVGKRGLMPLSASYSSLKRHWDRVVPQMQKEWLKEPWYQDAMDVIEGIRSGKPRSKYNPAIMFKRPQGVFDYDNNTKALHYKADHPYLDLFYNTFKLKFYKPIDFSKDDWHEKRHAAKMGSIECDNQGYIDISKYEGEGNIVYMWWGYKGKWFSGGSKPFYPWGKKDFSKVEEAEPEVVGTVINYDEEEDEDITNATPDPLLVTKAKAYLEANLRKGKKGTNWKRVLIAFDAMKDDTLTPMTAEEAGERAKKWSGWNEFADELNRLGL